MAIIDLRLRAGSLFLAVMVGHILLISAQVSGQSGVPVLEAMTFGVFAEVQRIVWVAVSGTERVWSAYVDLRHVKVERDDFERRLAEQQVQLQAERAAAGRSRGLEQLLDLRDRSQVSTVAAEIIAAGASPDFRTVTIDKGTRDGLRSDMAIIAPAGIVGRVVVPSFRSAKVQLLIDRNAAAGAIVERSRAQGVVVGGGDDRLRLDYVSEVADVAAGDRVVTSGIDGIFPKGFVIGLVDTVEKSGGAYKQIVVKPAVDFRSLEDVLVVPTPSGSREPPERGVE